MIPSTTDPEEMSCRISLQMPGLPTDFLHNFIDGSNSLDIQGKSTAEEDAAGADLQLTLGLSLNGRFGVDPGENKLLRSSSIPEFVQPLTVAAAGSAVTDMCMPILRTSSLPMETEDDECRKRKAMQSLRRMEAKRKRTEKQRNSRAFNGQSSRVKFEGRSYEDRKMLEEGSLQSQPKDQLCKGSSQTSFGMSDKGKDSKGHEFTGESDNINDRVASQGSGSSVVSEFQSLTDGSNKCLDPEARSPLTVQCMPDNNPKSSSIATAPSGYSSNSCASTPGNGHTEAPVAGSRVDGVVRDVLLDMPCVSTVGDGPNGKKIEGFLYRYKKGEEVKIVCVCHGSFLSPAEFVKHAGGGDVVHPLKHIVVSMSPFIQ